nr:hypothetical protein [Corynebacterium lactis]
MEQAMAQGSKAVEIGRLKPWLLGWVIGSLGVALLGFALDVNAVFLVGFVLLCLWVVVAAAAMGYVLPPRAMPIGLVGVVVFGGVAFLATSFVLAALSGAVAVGLAVGVASRAVMERRARRQESRLDALPLWERDELGEVARTLRPAYRRRDDVAEPALPHPTAKMVAALAKPLAGSTVIVSTNDRRPVLAVYGSRVAVVYAPARV